MELANILSEWLKQPRKWDFRDCAFDAHLFLFRFILYPILDLSIKPLHKRTEENKAPSSLGLF